MDKKWMIYGANGYTGSLTAELAVKRGLKPVLAARSEDKVRPIAQRLNLEHRVFGLEQPEGIEQAIKGIDAVLHMAGPFSKTSGQMVDACLATGAHYLDITGEFPVFDSIFARDREAKDAGVALIPGAGFDVVPTDCLAKTLANELPDATELELAFGGFGQGLSSISRGTLKTMIQKLGQGSLVRINGKLTPVPFTWRTPKIPFAHGERSCITMPWGDVSTAFHSTGIPNIAVYMAAPSGMYRIFNVIAPVLRLSVLKSALTALVQRTVVGPDEKARQKGRSFFWGRVKNEKGQSVTATMSSPEGYTLTADSTIKAVQRILEGRVSPGALTPSLAFGPDFVQALEGVEMGPIKRS